MTQEEKDLLLKDLCARLPYGVMVNAQYKDSEGWKTEDRKILGFYKDGQVYLDCVYTTIDCIKPYLRPMSSMTEEECKTLGNISATLESNLIEVLPNIPYYIEVAVPDQIDWLNAHHFDYRGLIEKDLALEAPEGMYEY